MGLAALPLAITLVVAPAQLKIESAAATAAVTVDAPGAARLRLWCSTGELSQPRLRDDGRFVASYRPPASGKPTYAVVAAWDEDSGDAATATVMLGARTEIPVETEAGAQVVALVHGRRSTARANAAGHARVFAWVWPGERAATVTAINAVDNTSTTEVSLEVARPDGIFLLAPAEMASGAAVRVYAFATSGATPTLSAPGASLSSLTLRPGVASAVLRARAEVTLSAAVGEERVQQRLRLATGETAPAAGSIALNRSLPRWAQATAPVANADAAPAVDDAAAAPASSTVRASSERPLSPWELGAAVTARYAGPFSGVGGVIEARRRLRILAVGVDIDGRWAQGRLAPDRVTLGGLAARLVVEARFCVARRFWLYVAADGGGHWAHLRRTPPSGTSGSSGDDGGPSFGVAGGVLVRLGPGLIELAAGYAWTPLVRNGLTNVDGAVFTVGYRAARWRRRGGKKRHAHRRCRARGR